jgi:hypothetical protein
LYYLCGCALLLHWYRLVKLKLSFYNYPCNLDRFIGV